MLILFFIFGFIAGGCVGVFTLALISISDDRTDEQPSKIEEKCYCRDCAYPVPADENGCYWCEKENCEVWPYTEACMDFTEGRGGGNDS